MHESVKEKLLRNADRSLTDQQKFMADLVPTQKGLQRAVYEIKDDKRPEIDGFATVFYTKI